MHINNNKKKVIDGGASSIRMTSRSNHLPILANNSLVFLSYEHMLLISLFLFAVKERQCTWLLFFFFGNSGCLGQFTRTTTNLRTHWTPCKPSRQVKHHGDDRRARWGSNPGDRGKETLPLPLDQKASVQCTWLLAPAASCNCPWIYRHC